jgi:hypothetical protein
MLLESPAKSLRGWVMGFTEGSQWWMSVLNLRLCQFVLAVVGILGGHVFFVWIRIRAIRLPY